MINKYQGCLFGLAIGDALGAPVEFLPLQSIKAKYGEDGITDFDEWSGFKAGSYTDDTQMSLATAIGCINFKSATDNPQSVVEMVYQSYLKWYDTQHNPNERRAPGNTCLNALASGKMGTIENRINNSKGCGGVMRTAPVGLMFSSDKAFQIGAECGAITHGHPSGYLPAGFISEMIAYIIEGKNLNESIDLSIKKLITYSEHNETLDKIELARKLSRSDKSIEDSIETIGEGWVGEEALAISIYCSLKFPNDFSKAVISAVNHSGDSDSTGSITGAILGTLLGIESIPQKWINNIENSEKIKDVSSTMFYIKEKL